MVARARGIGHAATIIEVWCIRHMQLASKTEVLGAVQLTHYSVSSFDSKN